MFLASSRENRSAPEAGNAKHARERLLVTSARADSNKDQFVRDQDSLATDKTEGVGSDLEWKTKTWSRRSVRRVSRKLILVAQLQADGVT